jgi:hypothetical protein
MNLKEVKREVALLSNVENVLTDFKSSWIKPIRSNTNSHLSFVNDLLPKIKKNINLKLADLNYTFSTLLSGQHINDKLSAYARNLIEIKLTHFNGDKHKKKMLVNKFTNDPHFNIKNTLMEIKLFKQALNNLSEEYHYINNHLSNNLSLDENVQFMQSPHLIHLQRLEAVHEIQCELIDHLHRHFKKLKK